MAVEAFVVRTVSCTEVYQVVDPTPTPRDKDIKHVHNFRIKIECVR